MNIIRKSANLTSPVDLYKMTRNATNQPMKNAIGMVLNVDAYIIYADADPKTGESREVISLHDGDTGDVYATNSPTFIREFDAIREIFETSGSPLPPITVISAVSKQGRTFITCAL